MPAKPKPSTALKIGFVFDDSLDKPDGVQQYILSVGDWLRSQGHDVHYLVGHTERSDLVNVHSLSRNLRVRFNGNVLSMPMPTSRRKLAKFLSDQSFDVIHVQVPYSPWLGGRLIAAAGPQTAVVGTFHIAPYSRLVSVATGFLGWYTRRTTQRFDEMLSVSSAAQVFAKQTFAIDSQVVPNAINIQRFASGTRLSRFDNSKLNIVFLGRLVPRKGCHILLEAVNILRQSDDDFAPRVIICGKGPELPALQAYVAKYKLENIVEFVGFVSEADKPDYYASADIAVFPSSAGESFGIVLVEAMASGRAAVLGGDNSGYRSVLAPQPALLFDPKCSKALADKLALLLDDQYLRKSLADWGGDYARQFDQAVVGRQILQCYDQALQKRRSR
ncbi:MAG: glycosyltransferase family 4 protein [Candidatus Saccharimonadales bacterium]